MKRTRKTSAAVLAAVQILFPLVFQVFGVTQASAKSPTDLFVGDLFGNKIWRVNPLTGVATIFVSSIEDPEDLELNLDGSLIVMQRSASDPATAQITLVSPDGLTQTAVTSPGKIQGVEGPSLDAEGNLFAQSRGNRGIFRLLRDPLSATGFGSPVQVVRGENLGSPPLPLHDASAGEGTAVLFIGPFAGDLLAAAPNEFRINRFTPGRPFSGPFDFAVPADFPVGTRAFGPVDAKQNCDGDVYITDANNRLLRFSSDGIVKEVLINDNEGLQLPAFIAIHQNGIVYFTQFSSSPAKIGRFDTVTNTRLPDLVVSVPPGEVFSNPLGIATLGCNVRIDIKPGAFPNIINPRSRGKIRVAILTTDTFDATTVDSTTVLFGKTGTEAQPVKSGLEDVDGDGDTDLILHFSTQDTGVRCGDTSAILTGRTFGGQAIAGSDVLAQ